MYRSHHELPEALFEPELWHVRRILVSACVLAIESMLHTNNEHIVEHDLGSYMPQYLLALRLLADEMVVVYVVFVDCVLMTALPMVPGGWTT